VKKIAAIVVTYYPDAETTSKLLAAISAQVDLIYIVDNTPQGSIGWMAPAAHNMDAPRPVHLALGDNYGIAKAHNVGIQAAIDNQCTHVILFDQDSTPPIDMVNILLDNEEYILRSGENLASVGPAYRDAKTNEIAPAIRVAGLIVRKFKLNTGDHRPVPTDHLISSGSLIRTCVLKNIGFMREELFIDWVDIEWGIRAKSLGYGHYICPSTIMSHSIGDKFVEFMGKRINQHSDMRKYYIVRNAVCLALDSHLPMPWRIRILLKTPLYIVFHSFQAKKGNIKTIVKLMILAISDGINGRLGRKGM
jgi:rhamnosyltransferase